MKIKILLYSVGRSDSDRYEPIINALQKHKNVELLIATSYIHHLKVFGSTFKNFKNFKLVKRNVVNKFIDEPKSLSLNLAKEIIFLTNTIHKIKPDIIIVLGDRYEMISAPIAALTFKIPVVHFYGGAITFGAIDEMIRHSISKMSHLHFTAHKTYSRRLLKMGEERWRVHTCGILNLNNLKKQKILSNLEIKKNIKIDLKNKTLLVTFHSTTLDNSNLKNDLKNLLKAIKKSQLQAIFTYPNSDNGHNMIINMISNFCEKSSRYIFLKNSSIYLYPTLLSKCVAMIGNSSSGIVESASFKLPVINLGSRQEGKVQGKNIINSNFVYDNILKSIYTCTSKKFINSLKNLKNVYEPKMTLKKIVNLILDIKDNKKILKKKFVD